MSRNRASSGANIANVPADVIPLACRYLRTSVPAPAASATAARSMTDMSHPSRPQALAQKSVKGTDTQQLSAHEQQANAR